jgi:hypothetical protein
MLKKIVYVSAGLLALLAVLILWSESAQRLIIQLAPSPITEIQFSGWSVEEVGQAGGVKVEMNINSPKPSFATVLAVPSQHSDSCYWYGTVIEKHQNGVLKMRYYPPNKPWAKLTNIGRSNDTDWTSTAFRIDTQNFTLTCYPECLMTRANFWYNWNFNK